MIPNPRSSPGIRIRLFSAPAGVTTMNPIRDHLISIHVGVPVRVACRYAGHAHYRLQTHGDIDVVPAAADLGAIVADLFTGSPGEPGVARVVHVEGPRRYAVAEMVTTAEALAGRPIEGHELPPEQWAPGMIAAGLGESHARLVAEMYAAHNAGKIEGEAGVGEVRRGTTTLAQAFTAILGHGAVAAPRMRGCF